MFNFLLIVGAIVLVFILLYNSLVAKKNQVDNIFASVDVMLKKRFDLIPNLVATLKKYMEHEKSLLEEVTSLRSKALKPNLSDEEKIAIDTKLSPMLSSLMLNVENYPDIKADKNTMHLQQTLLEVEEQISASRRAYNQAVTDYNNAIEMFPTNIVASFLKYTKKPVFEAKEIERTNVDVAQLFDK